MVLERGYHWIPSPWKISFHIFAVRDLSHLYFNLFGNFNAAFYLIGILQPISNILELFKLIVPVNLLRTLLKSRF